MNKNNKPAVNDSIKYTQNTEAQTFTKAYALSLSKVLKQGRRIRAMNSPNEWSDTELEILRTYYPTEGYKRCQEEGVQKTISMITAKATSMGLKRITGDSQDNETSERYIGNHINSDDEWTHKEINILKKHFPHGGCEACKENGNIKSFVGRIVTGDQFVADPAKVKWFDEEFKALACEMEGGSIAQVCYLNKIPFVVIRSISDNANNGAHMDFAEFTAIGVKNSTSILKSMVLKMN